MIPYDPYDDAVLEDPAPVYARLRREAPVLLLERYDTGFLFASANRDEREFPEPDRFRVLRRPRRTLAFGNGIHVCLGRHVARAEARVALAPRLAVPLVLRFVRETRGRPLEEIAGA